MILTHVYRNVNEIPDLGSYHIETAQVAGDDLLKSILRVTSDHGNDYGIRLAEDSQPLENGAAFELGGNHLLVLSVKADQVIVVKPKDIDEMGEVAHLLGNLHKPVQIKAGQVTLLLDPVVVKVLKKAGVDYQLEKIQLDKPLQYADLTTHGN